MPGPRSSPRSNGSGVRRRRCAALISAAATGSNFNLCHPAALLYPPGYPAQEDLPPPSLPPPPPQPAPCWRPGCRSLRPFGPPAGAPAQPGRASKKALAALRIDPPGPQSAPINTVAVQRSPETPAAGANMPSPDSTGPGSSCQRTGWVPRAIDTRAQAASASLALCHHLACYFFGKVMLVALHCTALHCTAHKRHHQSCMGSQPGADIEDPMHDEGIAINVWAPWDHGKLDVIRTKNTPNDCILLQ
jgi:hypothetical protein